MKMLFTAVVMMIASPALAQTAPASGPAEHAAHAGHAAQSGHAGQTGAAAADPHAGHDMSGGMMDCCKQGADGTMACCAKMKTEGKKMACCDKPAASASSGADPHAGHDMSPND